MWVGVGARSVDMEPRRPSEARGIDTPGQIPTGQVTRSNKHLVKCYVILRLHLCEIISVGNDRYGDVYDL